jgi:hypothetical protein
MPVNYEDSARKEKGSTCTAHNSDPPMMKAHLTSPLKLTTAQYFYYGSAVAA